MPRILTYNVHRCVGNDRRLDVGRRAVLPLRAWVIQPPQAEARPAIEPGQRHQAQRALPRWLGQAYDEAARREWPR